MTLTELLQAVLTIVIAAAIIGALCWGLIWILRNMFKWNAPWMNAIYIIGGIIWLIVVVRVLGLDAQLW